MHCAFALSCLSLSLKDSDCVLKEFLSLFMRHLPVPVYDEECLYST